MLCVALVSSVEFDCFFSEESWPKLGKEYSCDAQVLFGDDDWSLQTVTGEHKKGKDNEKVIFLSVNVSLPFIPSDINKFFPKLKGIQWANTGLESITSDDLEQFPSLEVFIVTGNDLTVINGDLFKHNEKKLEYIDFRNNSIEQVGPNLLRDLKLKEVNFIDNLCISTYAKSSNDIKDLILQLAYDCPMQAVTTELPATTTPTHAQCSDSCLSHIEAEVSAVDLHVAGLVTEIESLRSQVMELREAKVNFEDRFVEIEKQLRELASNPCSMSHA